MEHDSAEWSCSGGFFTEFERADSVTVAGGDQCAAADAPAQSSTDTLKEGTRRIVRRCRITSAQRRVDENHDRQTVRGSRRTAQREKEQVRRERLAQTGEAVQDWSEGMHQASRSGWGLASPSYQFLSNRVFKRLDVLEDDFE
ncbi:unnamed protein product [Amoebophrya sp. A25]|nr:unnamed protein product [Amoebophrya sp. A25]|eukprot:GSA25T00016231001.1